MLPIPFEQYIPKSFNRDAKVQAFADEVDKILNAIISQTWELNNIYDPARTKNVVLNFLGKYLNAGINNRDSELLKRQKIYQAIMTHKVRGTFNSDVKIKIDNIAGGDSSIVTVIGEDDFILTGDGTTPSAYYWATLGVNGIDNNLGCLLIGSGLEIEVAGNIYIDTDNDSLTAAEQEQIELDIYDSVPAYYYTHIGYVDGTGEFVEYFLMG